MKTEVCVYGGVRAAWASAMQGTKHHLQWDAPLPTILALQTLLAPPDDLRQRDL